MFLHFPFTQLQNHSFDAVIGEKESIIVEVSSLIKCTVLKLLLINAVIFFLPIKLKSGALQNV